MTSNNIYTPIIPTVLYIKQHSVTGLLYFGKTTTDPYKYLGSGKHWSRHIKNHGKQFVETIWVSEPYYDTSIVEVALHFSAENNIVESKEWANLEPENGLNGSAPGKKRGPRSTETKAKISASHTGKKQKPHSVETKAKISASKTGNKLGHQSVEHIAKRVAANTGKTRSDESKAKMSASKKLMPFSKSDIIHLPLQHVFSDILIL